MLHFAEPQHPSLRLGAVLAGGKSRRFGTPKQVARVHGIALVERVADALRSAGAQPVLITAPGVPDLRHLLPWRLDQRPEHGPLGGLETALIWTRELGLTGTLCVACDLPFVAPTLLRRIAEIGESSRDLVVAPESPGPLGVEPLCAWYPASAAAEVAAHLDAGQRSLGDLLSALPLRRVALAEVSAFGDPLTLFLNVNTRADGERAEAVQLRIEEGNGAC